MRITLKDIAAEVGVTEQAVSYALRGVPKVSIEMRERILAQADRLGYRPHVGARAMASGRFSAFTLLQDGKSGYSFLSGDLLRGIIEATDAGGRHLNLARLSREQMENKAESPRALRELCTDGFLVNVNTAPPPALPDLLKRCGIPSVWLNIRRGQDCVHPDDHGASRDLVHALYAQGCRRIVYADGVQGESDAHYSKADRLAGYLEAVRVLKIPVLTALPPPGRSRYDRSASLVHSLTENEPADGLIGYSPVDLDYYIYHVRPNLKSGTGVRLASFFNRYQQMQVPALRAEIPGAEMAVAAVDQLTRKLARPRAPIAPCAMPFHMVLNATKPW